MSIVAVNSITDASGGNTASINGYSPTESNMAGRNLIINGDFQVSQRGTSFSAIGSATYTLDRWRGQSRASSVINVTKVDNVNVDGRIMSALQHQVTTPATDGLTLQNQFVEDGSITLLGQTVTVSCWARVTVGAATIEQQFEVDGGAYTFTSGVTTLTTSFQRIAFTATLSGYTTSISYKHLRYQLYIRGASAHTVQITGVQLEVGSVATPFEHRSYGDELALCQRYYEKSYNVDVALGAVTDTGQFSTAANNYLSGTYLYGGTLTYKVPKRAVPSLSYWTYNGTANRWYSGIQGSSETLRVVSGILHAGTNSLSPYMQSVGASDNVMYGHWAADAEL